MVLMITVLGPSRFSHCYKFFQFKNRYVIQDSSLYYKAILMLYYLLSLTPWFQLQAVAFKYFVNHSLLNAFCCSNCQDKAQHWQAILAPVYSILKSPTLILSLRRKNALASSERMWRDTDCSLNRPGRAPVLAGLLINRTRSINKFSAAHSCSLFPYHKCYCENTTGAQCIEVIE